MAKDKDRRKESKGKQPSGGKSAKSGGGYQDRQMDTAHKGGKSGGKDRDRR